MSKVWVCSALALGVVIGQNAPTETKVKKENLKSILTSLGYKPKDLGNNVCEIEVKRAPEKVFVAVSVSPSGAKIWLTGNYGALTPGEKLDPEFLLALLEKNGEMQPTHFYVRKGRLNIGVPLESKLATPAVLNREIVAFADDVVKTKTFWDRKE